MSFGTGMCGICRRPIRWDDEFCGDLCEAEAERRSELPDGRCVTCGEPCDDYRSRCTRCVRNMEEDRMNRELGR